MRALRFAPWRSARLGWLAAAALLAAGVPPFLRMPPWCDLTLYDLAARAVAGGGVHYRDVFDTNPPGFVGCLVVVRAVLGPSVEAVRAVDLLVVAAVVGLLLAWAKKAGASAAAVAWAAAGVAGFYPFASEFNHAQRDVWIMLPVAAVGLRRVTRAGRDSGAVFWPSVLEGVGLGLGAWVKPHLLFPAAAAWLATAPRVGRSAGGIGRDFLGNLLGGLLALAGGVGWLVASGAWAPFLDVWQNWNPGYLRMLLGELGLRCHEQLWYFPPWGLMQPVALGLAGWAVVGRAPDPAAFARRALAAVFLAWVGQAFFLQRGFQYVHIPETLLMLAVFASFGWAAGFAGLACAVAALALPVDGVLVRHPAFDPVRSARWLDCWRVGLPPREYAERRNAVGFQVHYFAGTDWVQLEEVAAFLRSVHATDGDVIAWHDSPHTVYLALGVRPTFRFQHVSTVTGIGDAQYERLRDELHATLARTPPPRFAVADLERVFNTALPGERPAMEAPGPGGTDRLPPAMRDRFPRVCSQFPWNQPAVFRSGDGRGRYVVLAITEPVGECRIPAGLGEELPRRLDTPPDSPARPGE